jgi:hypothetical protein
MTIEELERDLRALAEPRESDESLRWATRARLGEQMLERPRGGRRGLRIATGAATAAAAAAAVIGVALLGGPGGSAGPSTADAEIVHHALRGLTEPASMIVHVKEDGVQNGTPVSVEWWQETSPPYALRMIKGWDGRLYEGAADGTTRFQYDADTNTILKTTGAKSPTRPVDPMASVRKQLANGDAQVAGTTTIHGETLYKIELSTGVIAYFNATTYRPVYLDNPRGDGSIVRMRVVTYEELPMTSQTEPLSSLTAQHPDARIHTRTAPNK